MSKKELKIERTGKNEAIVSAVTIVPALEKGKAIYKIVKITFTMKGQCVTIPEVLATASTEFVALVKLHSETEKEGITDLKKIRATVKELKEEK